MRERTASEDLRRRFPGLPLEAPARIAEPSVIEGDEATWLAEILEHSHELGLARGETQKAQMLADRSRRDRLPDPTLGLHVSSERGGEEQVMGAYISIPLPGGARRSGADAAFAQANAASFREADSIQNVTAAAGALYHSAKAARASWQASQGAAEKLTRAAEMTARAYQLGEGSLSDLLSNRRLANEAQLAARLAQLDALELRYRLLLDAHRLWDVD